MYEVFGFFAKGDKDMLDFSITVLQEIAEEEVPMAAAPKDNLFSIPVYIGVCVILLFVIFLLHYLGKCYIYQKRATRVAGKKKPFRFNIKRGKRNVYEEEAKKAAELWEKMQ